MSIQTDWRKQASDMEANLEMYLSAAGVNKNQVIAIGAVFQFHLYNALADLLDVTLASGTKTHMSSLLAKVAARNAKARLATVNGNWEDFIEATLGDLQDDTPTDAG